MSVIRNLPSEGASLENNYLAEMCSGSDEGSYLRLKYVCITQLEFPFPGESVGAEPPVDRRLQHGVVPYTLNPLQTLNSQTLNPKP